MKQAKDRRVFIFTCSPQGWEMLMHKAHPESSPKKTVFDTPKIRLGLTPNGAAATYVDFKNVLMDDYNGDEW